MMWLTERTEEKRQTGSGEFGEKERVGDAQTNPYDHYRVQN